MSVRLRMDFVVRRFVSLGLLDMGGMRLFVGRLGRRIFNLMSIVRGVGSMGDFSAGEFEVSK
jgi:hypothetical protein